jgi:hypothetical protein
MIMSNPAKFSKNQRINIVAKCLLGECRLLYKKKTNTAVLGKVIINHSEVENHRRLSSCNKPEPCILINIPTYRGIFFENNCYAPTSTQLLNITAANCHYTVLPRLPFYGHIIEVMWLWANYCCIVPNFRFVV